MKRMHYLKAWRRRFGFQCGQSFVAVREYRSRENATPSLSFVVALTFEETIEEIQKLVRTEIHRRISPQQTMNF
jgi:hypothetical protein